MGFVYGQGNQRLEEGNVNSVVRLHVEQLDFGGVANTCSGAILELGQLCFR